MLTAERLREIADYDPETGIFTSKILAGRNRWRPGRKMGWKSKGGVAIAIDGRAYKAHRLAWLYMTGDWPAERIDHRDTDFNNNRWKNLRLATHSQNLANRGATSRSLSGVKGVGWVSRVGKWRARIMVNYREKWLGYFDTKEAAIAAYQKAATQHFGEFART